MVDNRVGSIEVGKDGDIVIADRDILVNTTTILKVLVNGKVVVDK